MAISAMIGCGKKYTTVSVEEFAKIIADTSVYLLDVRTQEEYLENHIPRAINIDVNSENFTDSVAANVPKDSKIAVYCRSGRRSKIAAGKLSKAGYKDIIDLDEGIVAWLEKSYPTTK